MFVKLNARNNIVEATDTPCDDGYIEVVGTVADNMPLGLLGFNGRANTPNYTLVNGAVIQRTAEDMSRDPYSDITPSEQERLEALEAAMIEMILRGGS